MRKILVLVLAVIFALGVNFSVSADPGKFVSSPSNNQAPELIGYQNSDEDCEAKLVITPYSNRVTLPEETRELLEEAYRNIAATSDLSTLNASIAQLAANLGIDLSDLAVSDMFDISTFGCDDHEDHGHFDITLKADSLKNFVCLLHYYNGAWRIVENAKVTGNGTHLDFTEKEFSPFAVVVNTGDSSSDYDEIVDEDESDDDTNSDDKNDNADKDNNSSDKDDANNSPQTGDNSKVILYAVIMLVSGAALFFIWKKSKKKDMQ